MAGGIFARVAIPALVLAVGAFLLLFEKSRTGGRLLCFMGAQTAMGLYMKDVLSNSLVSEAQHLRGLPAGFAVTAIQQMTCCVLMLIYTAVSQATTVKYTPKQLSSVCDVAKICLFSFAFVMNIAMNNFSLTFIALSVNLIIRSCFPLPTWTAQQMASLCINGTVKKDSQWQEVVLMLVGCMFAVLAVTAKTKSAGMSDEDSENLTFGIIICVISLFSGSMSLTLAGVLGESVKMNEFDTVLYMAPPSTLLLLGPIFFWSKPSPWGGKMTDWQILSEVWILSPETVGLVVLSGVFALAFNLLKYGVVQSLSATHTALAGNFNKAFTIVLAMCVGLEPLPEDRWGVVMVLAMVGNICAFTAYSVVKERHKLSAATLVNAQISNPEMVRLTPPGSSDTESGSSASEDEHCQNNPAVS